MSTAVPHTCAVCGKTAGYVSEVMIYRNMKYYHPKCFNTMLITQEPMRQ